MKTFLYLMIFTVALCYIVKAQSSGYALYFDGENDYVDMGNASTFDIGNSVTYEAWINPDTTLNGFIFNKWVGFLEDKQLLYAGNRMYFYLFNVFGGTHLISSPSIPLHQYTHIAATYDASAGIASLYINGVFDTSKSVGSGVGNSTGSLYYGSNPVRSDFIAPFKGVIDGRIDGLTGVSISSGQFNYGVDYLGWYIKQACERWRQDHNEELDSIDIISHSTGGLVTRTYIQSDAYGAVYDNTNNYNLPKIRNFVMIGVPNRGASKPWNPIQDNWTGDVAYRFVLSKIINRAYQKVLQDKIITGPDGNITKSSIMDSSGVPNKELFISKYVPTIRYLLATYDFIDFGNGLTNINNDDDNKNTILLDLNNGFDINPLNDPNGFLDSANVTVIYGTGETTKFSVIERTDFEFAALQSFTDFTPSTALPGSVWYKDIDFDNNGDGTVPTISSAGQFLIDTRATLIEFTTGDHTKLVSKINVQSTILDLLDVPYNLADISTGNSTNYDVVSNIISDPVELVLTDGSGNRIGYTNATGAITEIQNSFWTGNTDGMGYVFGSVQEPLNLQLTGLGADYYIMVSVEDSGKSGGVVLEGFLAAGEVINYQITLNPVSVEQNNSLIPQNFALAQNYPNPFNPSTKINWQSPVGSHQILKIYDVLGNEVATLVDEFREAGKYVIEFNGHSDKGQNLSSGVYFYRLQAGSFVETKKMILLR